MKEILQESKIEVLRILKNICSEFVRETLNSEPQYKSQHCQSSLELNDQNSSVRVIPEPTIGSERQEENSPLYFDNEAGVMWLGAGKKTSIEPKDADVLKAIVDVTLKKNRHFCRREEILSMVYEVEVTPKQKLPKENDALNSAISTINGKCKTQLGMREKLIDKDGLRMIKLTRNIEIRKL